MADLTRRSLLALAGLGAAGTALSAKRLTATDIEGRDVDALNVAILGTAQDAASRSSLVAAFNRVASSASPSALSTCTPT